MSAMRRYPAVYAGLAGALGAAIPHTAMATSSARDLESLASGMLLPLFFGTLVGAGIVGLAALVTSAGEEYEDDIDISWPRRFAQPDYVEQAPLASDPREISAPLSRVGARTALDRPAAAYRISPESTGPYVPESSGYVNALARPYQASNRMRGVAAVLAERISGDPLGEGVMLSRSREVAGAQAASRWEGAAAPVRRSYQAPARASVPAYPAPAADTRSIDERIARIDTVNPYELPHIDAEDAFDDLWNSALLALDERIIEQPLSFVDEVGDSETLDEPDGLEVDTDFIPFCAPAGHPEVVDTESYVDYLVRQEFALRAARNAAHLSSDGHPRFLRLVEGGTGVMTVTDSAPAPQGAPRRLILSPAERKLAYRPRHLKPGFAAQEA